MAEPLDYGTILKEYLATLETQESESERLLALAQETDEELKQRIPPITSKLYWQHVLDLLSDPGYLAQTATFPISMTKEVLVTGASFVKPSIRGGWGGTIEGAVNLIGGFIKPFINPYESFYEDPAGTALMWYFGGKFVRRRLRGHMEKALEAARRNDFESFNLELGRIQNIAKDVWRRIEREYDPNWAKARVSRFELKKAMAEAKELQDLWNQIQKAAQLAERRGIDLSEAYRRTMLYEITSKPSKLYALLKSRFKTKEELQAFLDRVLPKDSEYWIANRRFRVVGYKIGGNENVGFSATPILRDLKTEGTRHPVDIYLNAELISKSPRLVQDLAQRLRDYYSEKGLAEIKKIGTRYRLIQTLKEIEEKKRAAEEAAREAPPERTPPIETPMETLPVPPPSAERPIPEVVTAPETPPAETPPAETPSAEAPPVETPPAEAPPAETPRPAPAPRRRGRRARTRATTEEARPTEARAEAEAPTTVVASAIFEQPVEEQVNAFLRRISGAEHYGEALAEFNTAPKEVRAGILKWLMPDVDEAGIRELIEKGTRAKREYVKALEKAIREKGDYLSRIADVMTSRGPRIVLETTPREIGIGAVLKTEIIPQDLLKEISIPKLKEVFYKLQREPNKEAYFEKLPNELKLATAKLITYLTEERKNLLPAEAEFITKHRVAEWPEPLRAKLFRQPPYIYETAYQVLTGRYAPPVEIPEGIQVGNEVVTPSEVDAFLRGDIRELYDYFERTRPDMPYEMRVQLENQLREQAVARYQEYATKTEPAPTFLYEDWLTSEDLKFPRVDVTTHVEKLRQGFASAEDLKKYWNEQMTNAERVSLLERLEVEFRREPDVLRYYEDLPHYVKEYLEKKFVVPEGETPAEAPPASARTETASHAQLDTEVRETAQRATNPEERAVARTAESQRLRGEPRETRRRVRRLEDQPRSETTEAEQRPIDADQFEVPRLRLRLPRDRQKRVEEVRKRLRALKKIADEVGYEGSNYIELQKHFGAVHPEIVRRYVNAIGEEAQKLNIPISQWWDEVKEKVLSAADNLARAYEKEPFAREILKRLWGREIELKKDISPELKAGTKGQIVGIAPAEGGKVRLFMKVEEKVGDKVEVKRYFFDTDGSHINVVLKKGKKLPIKPIVGLLAGTLLLPEILEAAQSEDDYDGSFPWQAMVVGGSFFVVGPALWSFFKKFQEARLLPENIKIRKAPPSQAYRAAIDGVRGKYTVGFKDFLKPVEMVLMDWEYNTGIPLYTRMYLPLMAALKAASIREIEFMKTLDKIFGNERYDKTFRYMLYEYRTASPERKAQILRTYKKARRLVEVSKQLDAFADILADYFEIKHRLPSYTPLRYPRDVLNAIIQTDPERLPAHLRLWQQMERKWHVAIPEDDVYVLFRTYIRDGLRAKFLSPAYEEALKLIDEVDAKTIELSGATFFEEYKKWAKKMGLKEETWLPKEVLQGGGKRTFIKEYLLDWLEHDVLLRPDWGDTMLLRALTKGVNTIRRLLGKAPTFTETEALHWLNTLLTVTYSSGIGAPASYLKNFTQAWVLGLPFVGTKMFFRGLKLFLTKEGRRKFKESGIKIDLPFERESATIGAAIGRLDGAIQRFAHVLMVGFDAMDTFNRSVVYLGVKDVALETLKKYVAGKIGRERVARVLKLKRYHPLIREMFWKYVDHGLIEDAAHILADQAQARTQFRYFQGNMPRIFKRLGIFRGRILGRFFGQFGTWQLWFADLILRMMKYRQYDALAGMVGVSVAAMWLANQLGLNINDWFLAGPFTPVRGPFPFAAGPVPSAVTGAGSAAIAWIRQMQGDPYAARMKADAIWQVKQAALMFVPGGRLGRAVYRALTLEEQPTAARLGLALGFSPKRISSYIYRRKSRGGGLMTLGNLLETMAKLGR